MGLDAACVFGVRLATCDFRLAPCALLVVDCNCKRCACRCDGSRKRYAPYVLCVEAKGGEERDCGCVFDYEPVCVQCV